MKRLTLLALIVALVSVSLARPSRSANAAGPALSDYFPETTFVYGELDSSNLPTTLKTLTTLARQFSPDIPASWQTLAASMYEQQFKRKVDFDQDLIGWIGDRIAVGVQVPPELFNLSNSQKNVQPDVAILIQVRDEAKADAFLADILPKALPASVKPTTETVGGNEVTLYALDKRSQLARWKGFIALGNLDFVFGAIKDKKPTLTGSALYKKYSATVKPGAMGSIFVRTPVSFNSGLINVVILGLLGPAIGNVFQNIMDGLQGTPTPTPSPTPPPKPEEQKIIDTFLALGASIYSFRMEGKALVMDVTAGYEADALKTLGDLIGVKLDAVASAPKAVSGKLLANIPDDASAVIYGSDLPQIYNSYLALGAEFAQAISILSRQPAQKMTLQDVQAQIDTSVKSVTGLDFKADILSWMTDDYAIYLSDDKGGLLDLASQGQFPLASNLLITSSDEAKAKTFAGAIAKLAATQMKMDNATPDANGYYTLSLGGGSGAKLGVENATFVLTTGTKFTLKPATAITANAAWKNASALFPKGYSQILYADTAKISALLMAASAKAQGSAATQLQQYITFLKPFESAVILYSPLEGNMGTGTFALIQK